MKTLKPFLYLLVVFAIVLSACNKNVHKIGDDENLDIQVRNMEDLIVPADFDWKMHMNSSNTLKAIGDVYYPASGYSTLAFEDLWPSKGDYDFNDLVVEYRFITDINADSTVGIFIFRAVGAGTRNGFGFELTGLDTTGLVVTGRSVMSGSYVSATNGGWEDGHGNTPVVIVAEDVTDILPLWSNTSGYGGITRPAEVVTIKIKKRPGGLNPCPIITEDNFNPFLIIDFNNEGRGREVHKVNYPPTALADLSFFGTQDDYSSSTFGLSSYKTIKNFPWVLDIPSPVTNPTASNSVFFYPTEKSDINWAYLKFAEWAESGGVDYGTAPTQWWVVNNSSYRNSMNIYNQTP